MVVGETMIVAGIGSRKGVSANEVIAAIDAALAQHRVARPTLSALATTEAKRGEPAFGAAAEVLGLPLIVVGAEATSTVETTTNSAVSRHHASTDSVSEAAALAAAGKGATLLGPRTVLGMVTCAIAVSEDRP